MSMTNRADCNAMPERPSFRCGLSTSRATLLTGHHNKSRNQNGTPIRLRIAEAAGFFRAPRDRRSEDHT